MQDLGTSGYLLYFRAANLNLGTRVFDLIYFTYQNINHSSLAPVRECPERYNLHGERAEE
jgi:hypothetical protein